MRGLVLGWYHKQNAGDDRLMDCITRWLGHHQLTFLTHTNIPPQDLLDRHDYVLIGGGSIANAVSGVFQGMQKWISSARIPVFCAGIGVSDHEEFATEFRAIPDSGGHVWVRDEQSAINSRLPANHVDVAPDLSWMYPRKFTTTRNGIALNLRPGGGPRVLEIEKWKAPLSQLPNAWPWPLCFGRDDDRIPLAEISSLPPSPEEFDPTGASRAELLVAMRFHALIFAIQSGTPFVAIWHTRKVQYLLEQTGLKSCEVSWDRPEDFQKTLDSVQSSPPSEDRLLETSDKMKEVSREYAASFLDRIEKAVNLNTRRRQLSHRIRSRLRRLTNQWLS